MYSGYALKVKRDLPVFQVHLSDRSVLSHWIEFMKLVITWLSHDDGMLRSLPGQCLNTEVRSLNSLHQQIELPLLFFFFFESPSRLFILFNQLYAIWRHDLVRDGCSWVELRCSSVITSPAGQWVFPLDLLGHHWLFHFCLLVLINHGNLPNATMRDCFSVFSRSMPCPLNVSEKAISCFAQHLDLEEVTYLRPWLLQSLLLATEIWIYAAAFQLASRQRYVQGFQVLTMLFLTLNCYLQDMLSEASRT